MRSPSHFLFWGERQSDHTFWLDGEETRHAVTVLRTHPGSLLNITDGKGFSYECRLEKVEQGRAKLFIISARENPKPKPNISCFVGMPEKEALERAIEYMAPLGIAELTPVKCNYCQDSWWRTSWEKYAQRFKRKLIAGVKQSLNPWLPLLNTPISFEEALKSCNTPETLTVYADQEAAEALIYDACKYKYSTINCWIGPPGGFSAYELQLFHDIKAVPIRLSPFRLRTEMAVGMICGTIRSLFFE